MIIRKRDIPVTPEQAAARKQRVAHRQARDINRALRHKKWNALTPAEKDQLLKALAVQFGFVDPD